VFHAVHERCATAGIAKDVKSIATIRAQENGRLMRWTETELKNLAKKK
jgi:hypothetical protein